MVFTLHCHFQLIVTGVVCPVNIIGLFEILSKNLPRRGSPYPYRMNPTLKSERTSLLLPDVASIHLVEYSTNNRQTVFILMNNTVLNTHPLHRSRKERRFWRTHSRTERSQERPRKERICIRFHFHCQRIRTKITAASPMCVNLS